MKKCQVEPQNTCVAVNYRFLAIGAGCACPLLVTVSDLRDCGYAAISIMQFAVGFVVVRLGARLARIFIGERIMKKHDSGLVLVRLTLAVELVRLANELLALLNMAINYRSIYEPQVDFKIPA